MSNETDLQLLMNNPGEYVAGKQNVIDVVVSRYIRYGFIPAAEKDDAIQFINLNLLDGIIQKMQWQYNPEFFLSTYLAAIINNLCKEYVVKLRKEKLTVSYDDYSSSNVSFDDASYGILLEEELNRLEMILKLYNRKRSRLILSLKLYFRMPILPGELEAYAKENYPERTPFLPETDPAKLSNLTDTALFEVYGQFLDGSDDPRKAGANLKRWVYFKMAEIVDLLNGENHGGGYQAETFQILFEKFCQEKSK